MLEKGGPLNSKQDPSQQSGMQDGMWGMGQSTGSQGKAGHGSEHGFKDGSHPARN